MAAYHSCMGRAHLISMLMMWSIDLVLDTKKTFHKQTCKCKIVMAVHILISNVFTRVFVSMQSKGYVNSPEGHYYKKIITSVLKSFSIPMLLTCLWTTDLPF